MTTFELRDAKDRYGDTDFYFADGVVTLRLDRLDGVAIGDRVIGRSNRLVRHLVVQATRLEEGYGRAEPYMVAVCVPDNENEEELRIRKHSHNGKLLDNSFAEYLLSAAPDILWYHIEDVGSYQGSVYGIGVHQGKVLFYADSYGSCSGCGAWGEGGEPDTQEETLARTTPVTSVAALREHCTSEHGYEGPTEAIFTAAAEALADNPLTADSDAQ